MRPVTARLARLLPIVGIAAACGEPPARVRLVPVAGDGCGRPAGATGLKITAYAAGGEVARAVGLDGAVDIADFPADTEQLGVEVVVGGGVVGAAGKTAPLRFLELADGAEIPIFMAPPDGFCPVGELGAARVAPLVAPAGDGVLVVGGFDRDGHALATAERFDPATGAFTAVAVPEVLGERGFAGAALTPLPDGRVVLSGGPQPVITIYDPATGAFGESVLVEARAFHVAIALDATHVLVAGGCTEVVAGACAGVARKSSKIYDVDALGGGEVGPALRAGRVGAAVFDVGVQADGRRRFVAAGGAAAPDALDPSGADRFALDADTTELTGSRAQAAPLDGGGVLTAFAPDGEVADGAAAVFAPEAAAARAVARAGSGRRAAGRARGRPRARRGRRGGRRGRALRSDARRVAAVRPRGQRAGRARRGRRAAARRRRGARGRRARRRLGRRERARVGVPAVAGRRDDRRAHGDPERRGARQRAHARGSVDGRARRRLGARRARRRARARAGGRAAHDRRRDPRGRARAARRRRADRAAARPRRGDRRRASRRSAGAPGPARAAGAPCTGGLVDAFDPAAPVTVELAIADGTARVSRDGAAVLTCAVAGPGRGAWGVAALGGEVAVASVAVAR